MEDKNTVGVHEKEKYRNETNNKKISKALKIIFQKIERLIHMSLNSKVYASLQATLIETLINVGRYLQRLLPNKIELKFISV